MFNAVCKNISRSEYALTDSLEQTRINEKMKSGTSLILKLVDKSALCPKKELHALARVQKASMRATVSLDACYF